MKTTYSRRELYALGEPIGESSTYELAGRRVYGGGGGGIVGDIVGGGSDALGGAVDAVGDVVKGGVDTVGDLGQKAIDTAKENPLLTAAAIAAATGGLGGLGSLGGTSGLTGVDAAMADLAGSAGLGEVAGAGAGVTGLGDVAAVLDPYEIYGSGASQWGGGGDYMDLGALSGTDLGGVGGSPASWGSGAGLDGAASAAAKKAPGNTGGGLSLGGAALGAAGLMGLLNYLKADSARYGTPGRQDNAGPLGQFRYSPASFRAPTVDPAAFRPVGMPTAKIGYARGGLSSLGGYSDGGRMLKGPGDGMSDSIPASIGRKQPARLADGEFVVPADVVSHLGNGSTDAGAKRLYAMMDNVRKARTGTKKQGKQIKADKYLPK